MEMDVKSITVDVWRSQRHKTKHTDLMSSDINEQISLLAVDVVASSQNTEKKSQFNSTEDARLDVSDSMKSN